MKHLPKDLGSEMCLLGSMVLDNDVISEVVDHVKKEDFLMLDTKISSRL